MVEPEVLAFRGKALVLYWTMGFFVHGQKNWKKTSVFSNDHPARIGMYFYGEFIKLSSLGGQRSGSGTRRVTDVLVLTTAPGHPGLPVF